VSSFRIFEGIQVNFQILKEKLSKCLQNTSAKMSIILFIKNVDHIVNSHSQTHSFLSIAGEIFNYLIIFLKIRDHFSLTQGAEKFSPVHKIPFVYFPFSS